MKGDAWRTKGLTHDGPDDRSQEAIFESKTYLSTTRLAFNSKHAYEPDWLIPLGVWASEKKPKIEEVEWDTPRMRPKNTTTSLTSSGGDDYPKVPLPESKTQVRIYRAAPATAPIL